MLHWDQHLVVESSEFKVECIQPSQHCRKVRWQDLPCLLLSKLVIFTPCIISLTVRLKLHWLFIAAHIHIIHIGFLQLALIQARGPKPQTQ